jgi:ankyrin repeat protein
MPMLNLKRMPLHQALIKRTPRPRLKGWLAAGAIAAVTCLPAAALAASAPPIVQAAVDGNAAAVSQLLSQGANPDARRSDGRTALMEAARLGRYDIVRELLVKGGQRDLKDREGRTAFDFAVEGKHSDIIALLRDAS